METSTPVTSEVRVRFPGEAGLYVIEWATLFDSVGLLRGLRFPPTVQLKLPNIVLRANNEQEFAHVLSTQYFKKKLFSMGVPHLYECTRYLIHVVM